MTMYYVAERLDGTRYVAVVYRKGEAWGDGELEIDDPDVPESLRDAKPGASLEVDA